MRNKIVGVLELLRDVDLRVVFGHFVSERDAACDAFADIAFVVHHDDFRAVLSDEFMAFVRDRIRHDQHRFVALHRADERESNALIATGRLNDDGIGTDDPLRFGPFDHLERSARLDRTAHIQPFILHHDARLVRRGHMVELDQRGIAERV